MYTSHAITPLHSELLHYKGDIILERFGGRPQHQRRSAQAIVAIHVILDKSQRK